jgi:hypothetical protein
VYSFYVIGCKSNKGAVRMPAISDNLHAFELDIVGNILWETQLCQFYSSKQDLVDIFFRTSYGLGTTYFDCLFGEDPCSNLPEKYFINKTSLCIQNILKS